MRISDWSSDVCSSDLPDCDISLLKNEGAASVKEKFGDKVTGVKTPFLSAWEKGHEGVVPEGTVLIRTKSKQKPGLLNAQGQNVDDESETYPGRWCFVTRSEEHTSELQSLMRSSYAVFCLNK